MPSFQSDLAQEAILSKYLDRIYADKGLQCERVHDVEQQHRGIDLNIRVGSTVYFIDEKAQLHYINADLPTFTFELSYMKDGILKEGWLFDTGKKTDYYFLVTAIYLKSAVSVLKSPEDISSLKITSVHRAKLIMHLATIGLEQERLLHYDASIRNSRQYGKNKISELHPTKEGLIFFTQHLLEKPLNLQLRLQYLLDVGVAKDFY